MTSRILFQISNDQVILRIILVSSVWGFFFPQFFDEHPSWANMKILKWEYMISQTVWFPDLSVQKEFTWSDNPG